MATTKSIGYQGSHYPGTERADDAVWNVVAVFGGLVIIFFLAVIAFGVTVFMRA